MNECVMFCFCKHRIHTLTHSHEFAMTHIFIHVNKHDPKMNEMRKKFENQQQRQKLLSVCKQKYIADPKQPLSA